MLAVEIYSCWKLGVYRNPFVLSYFGKQRVAILKGNPTLFPNFYKLLLREPNRISEHAKRAFAVGSDKQKSH